jgi:hypothetical protein
MMISLQEEFERVETGNPVHFRNLTLLPLLRRKIETVDPGYLLLDDAIAQGLARVTELGGGSVPELQFENRSDWPVLLLDGQELVGAKQNRVLNLTILAPARQTITIPVSCVEAGRWSMRSPDFKAAEHVMYSRGRAARAEQVTLSMRRSGTRRSDQSGVWDDIAQKAQRMGAQSPTHAMAAMFERHAISVEQYVRAFQCEDAQAGIVFAIDGRPLGIDLFDHPATMRKLFPKLVRSYALDALDSPGGQSEAAGTQTLRELLVRVASSPSFAQPALGLGKDVRLNGLSVSGAALWAEERYIHICAFATNGDPLSDRCDSHMSRPTRRRM